MALSAIILAAGKSTRMKSKKPKVLHEVCGRPMLEYVMRACFDAGCLHVFIVVGHGKDDIVAAYSDDPRVTFVEQTEQLGTGHAARVCIPALEKHAPGDVFILAGDGPLIRAQVLKTLLQAHRDEEASASMATAELDDPTGYGRVIRDDAGNFLRIVEQLDGTPDQLAIREVFPSYYCVRSQDLLWALPRITAENQKREFYLTDLFAILRGAGKRITAVQAVAAEDILGVNTRQQLSEVDDILQLRIQRHHRETGVTIVSSATTYIEHGCTIGPDTVIEPFTFIGRGATIGGNCTLGPFASIQRDSIVPEGTVISGNLNPQTTILNTGLMNTSV